MRAIKLVVALLLSVVVYLSVFGCVPGTDAVREVLHKYANETAGQAYDSAAVRMPAFDSSCFDFEIKELKVFKSTKIESKDFGNMQRFYDVRCRIVYKMKWHDAAMGHPWEYTRWSKMIIESTPGDDIHVLTRSVFDVSVAGTHVESIRKMHWEMIKVGEDMMKQ